MSFQGDLASISVTDLLQNLDANARNGTLEVSGVTGGSQIYVSSGRIALLATEGREPLFDRLYRYGLFSDEDLTTLRGKRRGSKRSLVDTAIKLNLTTFEAMRQAAEAILIDDICELISTVSGEFRFHEGDVPARVFDPEERKLELGIAIGPLLLEAARVDDHRNMVRRHIPSNAVRFAATGEGDLPDDIENPELAGIVLGTLDGTLDVTQVLDLFPGRRSIVFHILGELVRCQHVRGVEADGLLSLASQLATTDPARALEMARDGLQQQPRNVELLELGATLAEQLGDGEGAVTAIKMLAHISLEDGNRNEGTALLERARNILPDDPAVLEKLLQLAFVDGPEDRICTIGRELVEVYRAPGLHAKAREVLERLVDQFSDSIELRLELARSRVDAGDPKAALRSLIRYGKVLISREQYAEARLIYEAVLGMNAKNVDAKRKLEMIDNETYRIRRERRRRFRRRLTTAALVLLFLCLLVFDSIARIELAEARSKISSDNLIEERRYPEVIDRLSLVGERHHLTPTYLFEIRPQIKALQKKLRSNK